MKPLNRIPEGRTISLAKQISTHMNDEVRPNTEKEPVEGRVVQPAK